MSDCVHEEVCGTCDVEPEECAYYEPKRGKCKAVALECGEGRIAKGQRVCSECGCYLGKNSMIMKNGEFDMPNFCPNCGREVVNG